MSEHEWGNRRQDPRLAVVMVRHESMMRLFFAIELSDTVKDAIQQAIDAIPIANPPWWWVARDNFHITLKFLGEVAEEDVPALAACGDAVSHRVDAFSFGIAGLGAFPSMRRPRVLFYKAIAGIEPMRHLAGALDEELARSLSLERERRPFRAHVTVARIKNPIPRDLTERLQEAPAPAAVTQTVDCLALMRSRLSPKGAKYERVKEFALSKSK